MFCDADKALICFILVLCRWWEVVPGQWGWGCVWTTLLWRGHYGLWDHVSTWLQPWWWRWMLHCQNCMMHSTLSWTSSYCLCVSSCVLSDDADDWDFDMLPKPSEVQNDLYASNEDEEDEGEDMEGTKVTVSCGIKNSESKTLKPSLHTFI